MADGVEPRFSDEDRVLLRDSVRGVLARHWHTDARAAIAAEPGPLHEIWRVLAGQGLSALGADPAAGGLGEALVVLQELGRAACPAPMIDAFLVNRFLNDEPDDTSPAIAALRDALATGDALVCVAPAGADPDPRAGRIEIHDDRAHGHAAFVDAAAAATHFLLGLARGQGFVLVDARAPGVEVTPVRAMGTEGMARVTLRDAPVAARLSASTAQHAWLGVSRILHAARAWGAADRAFELAVDYVKTRRQFGQPVGRFQAIQHKLADNLIALTGVRLALQNAAEHFDRGIAHWEVFANALWSFATEALRQVALQTHHAFGAIGYAEDHEAPRHFRRVHLDMVRHGGARAANEALAARYLDDGHAEFPEYDFGPSAQDLRHELRDWLAEHWPPARRAEHERNDTTHREFHAGFARELGQTGWIGLTWPEPFGGMARSPFELLVYMEEMERAGAPRAGAPIQSAALMLYGSPEQQRRYLPELLRGEVMYGMWYSEPDSGSDLASIRTRAVRDGDDWVINGQKIWTTTYWGDYMWLAARTDPDARPPHAGISMFLLPSDTPGITRTPMRTMYDGEFCNTFFDDVRVPADALVGELNGGWQVLVGSLGTERAYVGGGIAIKTARQFEALCDHLRRSDADDGLAQHQDPVLRQSIGRFAARIEIGRLLALNSVTLVAKGLEPTWEAAMAKVFAGELMEQFGEAALDLLGMRATLSRGSVDAPLEGQLEQKLRHSLMWVISIGTNEIQRSLIAQRGLGLPR
ncbi:MAG: acyl-CoA dehydrogenase family protein [Burkholderiaceae bacterium]|nr:acyl-CoA dehydrogenase family protein [Burkholderiaceae bacterium]